eukprot:scaffold139560_cov36-Prasinocladus_malaysianus.AAC.1
MEECILLGRGWMWCPTVDVVFYIVPQYILVILPGCLWLFVAVNSAAAYGHQPAVPSSQSKGGLVITSGALLLLLWANRMLRLAGDLGWSAVVFSPGIGWPAPLALAAIISAARQQHKQDFEVKGE